MRVTQKDHCCGLRICQILAIGTMLRIQSEQLRSQRFDRAEKLAAEAPVKMLGPLMLCIFPAVFIVLLGPIISQAMKGM